jgi:hypothetical protein
MSDTPHSTLILCRGNSLRSTVAGKPAEESNEQH